MSNDGLWWIIVSAIITVVALVIAEKETDRFVRSYGQLYALRGPLIFILTLNFVIEAPAFRVFVFILVLLKITSLVKPLFKKSFRNGT